ncbi:hypothetical protein ONE63_011605 [Megalurothrips usitatus]|uniref:Uncharacterized protein n=1 Tax=Megalurothrips usitatus TaxID=439358 RepID=A0AAV7X2E5_9NEOP|nr:hypothetical protein ONE63_011605 [Megalurothrips usitatus]
METRRRLLGGILTLVCFALCSGIADAACRDTAFSCKDGSKCLLIYRKCNGVAQCRDRSDEDPDMCGKAATARIALGEVLRAKVQYKAEHESVQFILCDGSSCGGFDVEGATSGGDLAFTSSEDENPMGDYGNEVNSSRPSDFHVFPTGELLFEVERRLHEVVVWLSGHKDKSISAPVKQNSSLLRVKPLAWHSDMPVELSVQQNVCGEYGFLCANGQCRQITDKCDGVKQCADGSDEDVAMCNSNCSDGSDEDLVICNTADSTDIHLGAVLTTKVQYKPEHEAIEFHLCGGQRCGVLRVMGVGSTGQLAYKSFTGANAMGAYGTLHSEDDKKKSKKRKRSVKKEESEEKKKKKPRSSRKKKDEGESGAGKKKRERRSSKKGSCAQESLSPSSAQSSSEECSSTAASTSQGEEGASSGLSKKKIIPSSTFDCDTEKNLTTSNSSIECPREGANCSGTGTSGSGTSSGSSTNSPNAGASSGTSPGSSVNSGNAGASSGSSTSDGSSESVRFRSMSDEDLAELNIQAKSETGLYLVYQGKVGRADMVELV